MSKHKKSARSIACDITAKARRTVYDRDMHRCIVCGKYNVQCAHYIPRSQGGLGIEENLVCLCEYHHKEYDNGKHHKTLRKYIESYLSEKYQDWKITTKVYDKWWWTR